MIALHAVLILAPMLQGSSRPKKKPATERASSALPSSQRGEQRPRTPTQGERRDQPEPQRRALTGLSPAALRRCEALCTRGATALLSLQNDEGGFRLGSAINPAPLAVDSLALLALLATGHLPGRGKRGAAVERSLLHLVERQDVSGGPQHGYFRADGDEFSKMHGHGYATLALSQVLGMLPRDAKALVPHKLAKQRLVDAIRRIEASQERNGGWGYNPVPLDHEGSMTICMLQALRGARDAGIAVDPKIIGRAIGYVERSQKPDGSFRYKIGVERSSIALTAAAVMTLQAGGQYNSPVLRKGLAYLTDNSDIFRASMRVRVQETERSFPYYARLYTAEALFSARDRASFVRWFERVLPQLEAQADKRTGLWKSERYGDAYATAMTMLVLSLPFQYLPIHQR